MPTRPPKHRPVGYKPPDRIYHKGDSYYKTAHWAGPDGLRSRAMRRDKGICVRPGCGRRARTVNHRVARPRVPWPTNLDALSNLECLCAAHDNKFHSEKGGHNRREPDGF